MRNAPVAILASRVSDNREAWKAHRKPARTVTPCLWTDDCDWPYLPDEEKGESRVLGYIASFAWGAALTAATFLWATS